MGIEHIRRLKEEAKLPKEKKVYRIPKVSKKKIERMAEEKEIAKIAPKVDRITSSLKEWFEDKMKTSEPVCMNCGMRADWILDPKYKLIWQASQAHILPKRKTMFPSVCTHPMNHLVLFPVWGGYLCGCHDEFDSSWYNATTMDVWPEAVRRFKLFEKDIKGTERGRIPVQFTIK